MVLFRNPADVSWSNNQWAENKSLKGHFGKQNAEPKHSHSLKCPPALVYWPCQLPRQGYCVQIHYIEYSSLMDFGPLGNNNNNRSIFII